VGKCALVPFPYVEMVEQIPLFVDTAPGIFTWRQILGKSLLSFPDLGGGDLSAEQRREGLERFVELQRPLTALALFWSVVALEDLFRDMGVQLNALPELRNHFKKIATIAPQLKSKAKPGQRLDTDPPYLDFSELNDLYQHIFQINAVDPANICRLVDLALIRHTVAHHGAVVRPIDLPRFRYYQMQENRVINPPVWFVRETAMFIHSVGSDYLSKLRAAIFAKVIDETGPVDPNNPSDLIKKLIRAFHYFGKIPQAQPQPTQPMPKTPEEWQQWQEEASKAPEADLLQRCLAMLPATS
jgi:hypothetical protein